LSRWLAVLVLFAALVVGPRWLEAQTTSKARVQGLLGQLLAVQGGRPVGGFLARRNALRRSPAGEVQVYVLLNKVVPGLTNQLGRAGLRVDLVDEKQAVAQGWATPSALSKLRDLPFVRLVREPDYLHTNTGLWETEGDEVLQAGPLREQMGADGSAVKVGVISDGVFGLLESVATGDLPGGGKVCGNPDSPTTMTDVGVECRSFRSDGDITGGGDGSGAGAEGTALLEVVHDLAPGADLFFANAATTMELGQAQDWLADTVGVDVILDDLAAFNVGPYDGTSSVSLKTSSQVGKGVTYVNAVGNYGNSHYVGWFTDTDGDLLHEFDASLGLAAEDGSGETLNVSVGAGGGATIYISWNDPFGASVHDCAVSLVSPADCPDCDLQEVLGFNPCSANVQDGVGDPVEVCGIYRSGTPGTVGLVIAGCPGVELRLFVTGDGVPDEFLVPERSVPNNSDARDVITAGAVGVVGDGIAGSPFLIRPYSSRGPTDDGRIKPLIVATDGVTISGAGGFGFSVGGATRFFGTSAAAPHVAGIVALLKELDPGATPSCMTERLSTGAVDLGVSGADNIYGAGRADALAAGGTNCPSVPCGERCCDLDGDCLGCGLTDCLGILEIVSGLRGYDCRADLALAGGGPDGIDLLDAVLCLRERAGLSAGTGCACSGASPPPPRRQLPAVPH